VYSDLSTVSEKLGNLDRAIAYKLEILLLDQLYDPERSDAYNTERASVYLVHLNDLLRRTGRNDWFAKLLPFSYTQTRRDSSIGALPEPLELPIDLSVVERAWGPADRSELIANTLAFLAQTYSWMDRHEEALPLFEQQARTFRTVFGEGSPQASAAVASMANEHRPAGRNEEAVAIARGAYGSALRYLNSRRSLQESPRAAEDALRPPTFALLEALADRFGQSPGDDKLTAEAFEAVQRLQGSKAALALQAFGERLGQNEPELQDFVRRPQDLTEQLKYLDERLLAAVANNSRLRSVTSTRKIALTEGQLQDLDSSRPAKLREFDELAHVRTLPYGELKKLLQPDEALITFADGDEATFAFVATREGLRSVRIGLGSDVLERMVITLRCGLDQHQWTGQDRRTRCGEATKSEPRAGILPFDLQTAHELYRALFGSFEDVIAGKQLLIVPTGAMTSLPLQVLVTKPITARASSLADYRDVAWLGRQHAITVLPSVGNLLSLRTAVVRTHAPEPYIGFGDPVLQGNHLCRPSPSLSDCPEVKPDSIQVSDLGAAEGISAEGIEASRKYYRGTLADVTAVRQICPLPDTARELSCVARSMSVQAARVVLGCASTETTVKREQVDRYRIIRFATHGLLARQIGVSEVTYYRRRQEFGGLKTEQVKRLKDLELENSRLRTSGRLFLRA
jgi:CHAT domain-containing protein